MKFLMDPVYTNRPSVCSTSYLVWELVEAVVNWRPDTYAYVLYPPNKMEDQDWKFMDKFHDRVTLLPLTQCTSDRVSEMFMLRNDLRFYLNPWNLQCWDADVVVSSRLPVMKHMRPHCSRVLGKSHPSLRMFVGLEEMPFLPFRDTVPWSDHLHADTLMSYALNDATLVNNLWTKDALRPVLREVLSPSWQKRVLDRVHEVVPVKLTRLNLRQVVAPQKLNVVFVGRITSTRNFGTVAEVFRDQYSFPVGKTPIEFKISTNSESAGSTDYGELDFVDMQMNDREAFWEFLDQAHVAVNLTTVEDFSLSTWETLVRGIPVIVLDYPWNSFLGKDYPFRARNQIEAYAMINAFARGYDQMYQKFVNWETQYWAQYVQGPRNVTTSERLLGLVQDWLDDRDQHLKKTGSGGSYRDVIQNLPQQDGKIDLNEHLRVNAKMFTNVAPHFSLPLGRVPTSQMLKIIAQQEGWKDTNTVGVMTR